MERLIKPAIDGGVPYINQDFFNALQGSNLLSYKSFIETINDNKGLGNSGIIIKGVINKSQSGSQISNFDFTNSMIYLDGDFLEPEPSLALQDNKQIDSRKFYLIKISDEEFREKKVSGFLDPILVKSYFDVVTDFPPDGQSYIEIEIKNDQNICSRYLDRILRYHLTDFGQVQMTLKKDFFTQDDGEGFGEMFGFHICNGKNNTQDLDRRYLIGYATVSNSTITDISEDTVGSSPWAEQAYSFTNYKTLSNKGGKNLIFISGRNLPPHDHGGLTGEANNDMRHNHEIQFGAWNRELFIQAGANSNLIGKAFARTRKIPNSDAQVIPAGRNFRPFRTHYSTSGFYPVVNTQAIKRPIEKGVALWEHGANAHTNGSDLIEASPALGSHRHFTRSDPPSSNSSHNNEPPYAYVIYYEKINPYTT